MTTHDPFDRELGAWLQHGAGSAAPDYLDETLAAIDNLHQRPSLAFPGRWLPVPGLPGWVMAFRRIPAPALIALLLLALLIGLGFAGGRLHLPAPPPQLPAPPYGLARTGLIAFDSDGRIVVANADGSNAHQLVPSDHAQFGATFSRDGRRIAYWQEDGWKMVHGANLETATDLWVADSDGSHAVNLTPDLEVAAWAGMPAGSWSPDGSAIVFVSDKDMPMYVVRTDGGGWWPIGDGSVMPVHPAWSPDGRRIAFAGQTRLPEDALGPSKVYVINADGTGQEQVSRDGAGDGTGALPAWSPDGTTLVYGVDLTAPRDPEAPMPNDISRQIEIVTATRGPDGWVEQVVVPPSAVWVSAFSNDGSRIAFFRSRPDTFSGDLFVVDTDGTGERMVSDRLVNASSPCWSPDDQHIAGLTGPIPPGGQEAGFGWPGQSYTLFPVAGGTPTEIPAGRVDGVFACSWQRLAP